MKADTRTRAEKVEGFRELLGLQLDAEIGRRAGVPADFVRAYREKLAIPSLAERRAGVTPAVAPRPAPAPTPPPAAVVATPRERKAPGGFPSALDAHLALFGKMHDAAIAQIAGVSRGAVYQYRHRRNIPAYDGPVAKAPAAPVPAPVAKVAVPVAVAAPPVAIAVAAPPVAVAAPPVVVAAPPVVVAAPPVAVATPPVVPPAARSAAPSRAYVVMVRQDEREEPYIVVGRDVADASALAMRAARGEIVSVRRYLPALA